MDASVNKLFSYSNLPLVMFEDYYLLVLYKPSGYTVERHSTYSSLEDFAQEHVQALFPQNKKHFIGVVHRLDVNVSGIVVMAKTRSGLKHLNNQFVEKKTRKIYFALVEGIPKKENDRIDGWITEDKQNRSAKFYFEKIAESKNSLLSYQTKQNLKDHTCLEIELETGRFHQIRASLSAIGCSILNDHKYGAKKISDKNEISLVAAQLDFLHPKTNEALSFDVKKFIEANKKK